MSFIKSDAIVDAVCYIFFKYVICRKVGEIGIIKFNVFFIIPWIVLLLLLIFDGFFRMGMSFIDALLLV